MSISNILSSEISFLIVVPTLNSFELLPRLVASLQNQTFASWRLCFVDGPSSAEHRAWLVNCCEADLRCSWVLQHPDEFGIFGAMNQGFAMATSMDYLLFWGSDDWAASPSVLSDLALNIAGNNVTDIPDLVVCRGRYVSQTTNTISRPSVFHPAGFLNSFYFRKALFCGATPPHQATAFGPGSRKRLARYSQGFRLSADLDYFLNLSRYPDICVQCLDLELVYLADGGVSGQQTQRRLREVYSAYRRAFGWGWFFPFFVRYLRRLLSVLVGVM